MNEDKKQKSDWPVILFLLVGLPTAFIYGGLWVGLVVLVVGVAALGWSKRHKGPFPINNKHRFSRSYNRHLRTRF